MGDEDGPPRPSLPPERRVMLAILLDAIHTVLERRRVSRRRLAELEIWFAADDRGRPLSFVNVCDTLRLDAAALRRWVALEVGR